MKVGKEADAMLKCNVNVIKVLSKVNTLPTKLLVSANYVV